jgi:hypothetical protein
MSLELRGSKFYYYRKRRSGSQVRTSYVAAGEAALQAYEADLVARRMRLAEQAVIKSEARIEREFAAVTKQVALLIRETLKSSGFHSHKGQWRKRRTPK